MLLCASAFKPWDQWEYPVTTGDSSASPDTSTWIFTPERLATFTSPNHPPSVDVNVHSVDGDLYAYSSVDQASGAFASTPNGAYWKGEDGEPLSATGERHTWHWWPIDSIPAGSTITRARVHFVVSLGSADYDSLNHITVVVDESADGPVMLGAARTATNYLQFQRDVSWNYADDTNMTAWTVPLSSRTSYNDYGTPFEGELSALSIASGAWGYVDITDAVQYHRDNNLGDTPFWFFNHVTGTSVGATRSWRQGTFSSWGDSLHCYLEVEWSTDVSDGYSWAPDAALKWGSPYNFEASPELYAEVGAYKVYNDGQFGHVFDNNSSFVMANLKAENPDIKVLAYTNAVVAQNWMATEPAGSFSRTFYDAMAAYPALDTHGNPWSTYQNSVMFNPTDSTAVETAVGVWSSYARASQSWGSNLGIMFDYMTVPQPSFDVSETDSLDLDQDGVWHNEDADEMQAMKDGYCYMLDLVASDLPGVLLIPNGRLPLTDSTVMGKIHGAYIEGSGAYWPSWGGYTEVAAMLHPDNPGNLLSVMGSFLPGGYTVLEEDRFEADTDEDGSRYSLALAMMFDDVYGVVQGESVTGTQHALPDWGSLGHWASVGTPTGAYYSVPDSAGVYRREFTGGSVRLEIRGSGQYPDPFGFSYSHPTA